MTSMSAAVWTSTDDVCVQNLPMPDVPQGWALVRVAYNGICGTDLSIVHGTHPRARPPLVMGHELAGWVEKAGATGPQLGALVIAEPLITCGECRACQDGHTHVCRRLGLYGIDAPGGLATYVALPPEVLHEVPHSVDPRVAALAEPLAVAVHAVRLARLRPGETVAVYGAGPIGVLTALVARHEGAGTVVVAEPSAWRRHVAEDLGFTVVPEGSSMTQTLAPLTDGEGADVTIDSAAHPSVAADLAAATRVLGRIIVVGVYKKPTSIDLQAVCFKEQSLTGVRVYTSEDVTRAIELIATGALNLDRFPTRAFPLADVNAALAAATAGHDCLKVLVTPLEGKADG